MRTNNVVVLVLAVVMGGIAAFMARQWLQTLRGHIGSSQSRRRHDRGRYAAITIRSDRERGQHH